MEENSTRTVEESSPALSIWETMVLEERKLEAERRGIRVCDLEEETSLFQALEESVPEAQRLQDDNSDKKSISISSGSNKSDQYSASSSRGKTCNPPTTSGPTYSGGVDGQTCVKSASCENDDDGHFDDEELRLQILVTQSESDKIPSDVHNNSASDSLLPSKSEVIQELSLWQLYLPQDLTNKILLFLGDVDMCGYLQQLAKTNCFKPNESIYKNLCEYIYTAQSKKKKFVVENWKSWRNMLGDEHYLFICPL